MGQLFQLALIDFIHILIIFLIIGIVSNILYQFIFGAISAIFGNRIACFIRNYFTIFGTIIHELSHSIFAAITGAKVTKIKFHPTDANTLGSVEFKPRGPRFLRAIQKTTSAIAPVVFGCMLLTLLTYFMNLYCRSPWQYCIIIYLELSILLHMNLSKQDIKTALSGLPFCLCILYLLVLLVRLIQTAIV